MQTPAEKVFGPPKCADQTPFTSGGIRPWSHQVDVSNNSGLSKMDGEHNGKPYENG